MTKIHLNFLHLEDKNTSTSNDMQSILLTVKNQELSLEDKEKLAMERSEIMREMNLVEAQIKQCNDILYNEQMELSKHKNKVSKLCNDISPWE